MEDKQVYAKPAIYCLFYENLKVIAKEFGYNLLIHGSINRDLDLLLFFFKGFSCKIFLF